MEKNHLISSYLVCFDQEKVRPITQKNPQKKYIQSQTKSPPSRGLPPPPSQQKKIGPCQSLEEEEEEEC
jgi:hypothetical protein